MGKTCRPRGRPKLWHTGKSGQDPCPQRSKIFRRTTNANKRAVRQKNTIMSSAGGYFAIFVFVLFSRIKITLQFAGIDLNGPKAAIRYFIVTLGKYFNP